MSDAERFSEFFKEIDKRNSATAAWKDLFSMKEDIVSAGFTEEQAMQIICTVLRSKLE